eukprot:1161992-Pelagomonas_calceolata.AAC.5
MALILGPHAVSPKSWPHAALLSPSRKFKALAYASCAASAPPVHHVQPLHLHNPFYLRKHTTCVACMCCPQHYGCNASPAHSESPCNCWWRLCACASSTAARLPGSSSREAIKSQDN